MRILLLTVLLLCGGSCISAYGQFFNMNPPTISGQRPSPLTTEKNTSITITFEHLRVSDPDIFVPAYPQGYTLTVFPGSNYSLTDATVIPENNFVGVLTVQVRVNDGKFDSNLFNLQVDVTNKVPVIVDQQKTSTKENTAITLTLSHLKVEDDDNDFPSEFTLQVFDGDGYSVAANVVTPDPDIEGKLSIPVSVNDGHVDSEKYDFMLDVIPNKEPVIKGQTPLSVVQGKKILVELNNLVVDDPDNVYPTDFILKMFEGPNYTLEGNTVVPIITFVGTLKVSVAVDDGLDESKKYELEIEITPKNNIIPVINNQKELQTNEDQSITLTLSDLFVTDPDNNYPEDFQLKIPQGNTANYAVSGNRITPAANFNGEITIPVRVNDRLDDSQPFNVKVSVKPVNDVPVITGQEQITVRANRSTAVDISRLTIADPDNQNVSSFKLKILPGTNYAGTDNLLTPRADFVGQLTVRVTVNDGVVDSAPFNLKVDVVDAGSNPIITGQQSIIINEDETILLTLNDLFVTDDDSNYPDDFSMVVLPGEPATEYSYDKLRVTPRQNMNGQLVVNVMVNDGDQNSNPFPLKIYVIPVNDAPRISSIEQGPLHYEPGSGPVITTEEFTAVDNDNAYLSFAEIGFEDSTFNPLNDQLLFENTEQIRGIYDPSKGILSLIGNATLEDYDAAIRSVRYNYKLTIDEEGNQSDVMPGDKIIYYMLSDGQLFSEKSKRAIKIESTAELEIPNAFTPNGDQSNDVWKVRPITVGGRFDRAEIKVYNKKGFIVYESKGFESSWDGSFAGEVVPTDTYYYTINMNLTYTKKTYKGTVTVLR